MTLLEVVRRHVDLKAYRAILGDLCEMDADLATLALDAQLIGVE